MSRGPPSEYVLRTVQAMVAHLKNWGRCGLPTPRFALPPRDVIIGATLDQVEHVVARDPATLALVHQFCAMGERIGGRGFKPTVLMLSVALDTAGMSAETASVEEFTRGYRRCTPGSSARN